MSPLRRKLFTIIFEAETRSGRAFDIALIISVLFSVIAVMLESVDWISSNFSNALIFAEWIFTIGFTLEYFLRIYASPHPWAYIRSFYGLVDLFSIVPTYLSVLFPGMQSLLVIRALRLIRVFRVLKLYRYIIAGRELSSALRQSRHKITVFLGFVVTMVFVIGTAMYLIEGKDNGFTSIPISVYWAVVTMTTVGYGDITPQTPLGQFVATVLMITGYGVLAVPTGIVSAELVDIKKDHRHTRTCASCSKEGHDTDALFCSACGERLGV